MDKFPVEILFSIFKHLPQEDLVKATQVCRNFKETIEKFELIKRLFITESENCDSSIPTRKYSEAVVKRYVPDAHQKVFEATGNHLKMLKFANCTLNLIDIVKILQIASNVKELSFSYVKLDDDRIGADVQLPQLNDVTLMFHESNPEIFNVFQLSSFVKMDLRFYADVPYSNFVPFINLLKTQERLTSLALSGIYESNLFLIPMGKANYRLKEFFIDNCEFEEWDGLEVYLAEHVTTLEKFTVKSLNWDPSSTLNHCVNLKTLQGHRTEMNFLGSLLSVEELSIEQPIRTMSSFPNTKRLFLSRSSPEANQVVSASMLKLEELGVQFGGLAGISIPTLKKLKLSSVDGVIGNEFFTINNKIADLAFENVFNIDDSLLTNVVTSLSNLKILRILGDNHLTSRAFTIIKENCKNLKVFEMNKWDQKFTNEDWKCLYDIKGLEIYTEKF
jgi:F-box-like